MASQGVHAQLFARFSVSFHTTVSLATCSRRNCQFIAQKLFTVRKSFALFKEKTIMCRGGRCCRGAGCGVWAPVLPGFGALALLLVFIRQIILEMAFCFCCNIRKSCASVSSATQLLAFFTRTCHSTIITL